MPEGAISLKWVVLIALLAGATYFAFVGILGFAFSLGEYAISTTVAAITSVGTSLASYSPLPMFQLPSAEVEEIDVWYSFTLDDAARWIACLPFKRPS